MKRPRDLRLLRLSLVLLAFSTACSLPQRHAVETHGYGVLEPIPGFEEVRTVDGYRNETWQHSFDEAIAKFHATEPPADGRRDFDMLVLSSGGVNGAFGAGILTTWTDRGDRPDFWAVTGVSVGALLAPFAFAGPEFDDRMEALFRRIQPSDLHKEKGMLTSVLWDESLMDNSPLRASIDKGVDHRLMAVMAERHREGRRCFVGSTNLDIGAFVIWDLGAIALRGTDEALQLMRKVLTASASIPVVYPPQRFSHGESDELHVDGAVTRPLFLPQNIFDGYLSAERAGMNWNDVDPTLYVVHNGSLRARPIEVQRDTLAIAMRTVTMMSYTMVSEHVLHLYMLSLAWGAQFRFLTVPDGLELSVEDFTPEDTERLFLLAQGLMEREDAWSPTPPGYIADAELSRIRPIGHDDKHVDNSVEGRLQRIERALEALLQQQN